MKKVFLKLLFLLTVNLKIFQEHWSSHQFRFVTFFVSLSQLNEVRHYVSRSNSCKPSQLPSRWSRGRRQRWSQERGQRVRQGKRQTQPVPSRFLSPALSWREKKEIKFIARKISPITVSCPKKMLRVAKSSSHALYVVGPPWMVVEPFFFS